MSEATTENVVTMPLAEIEPETSAKVMIGDAAVCVVRIGDDVYAIGDVCSHAEVSLSGGEVYADDCEIECPKHGSTFDLRTGEPQVLPATQPVPVYDVTVADGIVTIRRTISEGESR